VQRAVNTLVEGERIVLGHTERALMERVPLQLKTLWLVEVGFLVPVVEELFFRGVQGGVGAVQNRVKAWLPEQARRWKGVEWLTSPSARIVFVQTLFALCHFVALREQGSPTQRTALTVAILCTPAFPILGERSLGEAMVAHATVNAWVFATRS
jgi:membrane protease YdiL (CAAX protease family)